MQQIPVLPSATLPSQAPVVIKPLNSQKQEIQNEVGIPVKSLQLLGVTAFEEAQLIAQTGFRSGEILTLTQLRVMTNRIADFYHQQGYFVTQVYLPPQNIQGGVVSMVVLEGRYEQVILQNESRASSESLGYFLKNLTSGSPILSAPLESNLLMMSDTPGVLINSSLVPGKTLGSSDLLVKATAGPRVNGSIDADNAGNRYTGSTRIGATLNVNELLGYGDVASLRAMSSGRGLRYLRGTYQVQFGKTTAGLGYSDLHYELVKDYQDAEASGIQHVTSLYLSQPLLRSKMANMYWSINLDNKRFQDVVGSRNLSSHKHADVLSATLRGDQSDKLGYTTYGLSWSAGRIDIKDLDLSVVGLENASTQGHFNKLSFNANRLQKISEAVSFYAGVSGQLASKNLDVSEKMELGGMYGIRAYPEGEAFGDEGYIITLETRLQLKGLASDLPGQMQLIGFIDAGAIHASHKAMASGENRRYLSGAGIGLNWGQAQDLMVRAYYAMKLGNETAKSAPDAKGRFWIQAVKYF